MFVFTVVISIEELMAINASALANLTASYHWVSKLDVQHFSDDVVTSLKCGGSVVREVNYCRGPGSSNYI
jgi:hypothetical protein